MIVAEATVGVHAECSIELQLQHWVTSTPIRKVYQNISECVEVYQTICTFVSNTVSLSHVSNKVRRAEWPHWICGHIIFVLNFCFLLSYNVIIVIWYICGILHPSWKGGTGQPRLNTVAWFFIQWFSISSNIYVFSYVFVYIQTYNKHIRFSHVFI